MMRKITNSQLTDQIEDKIENNKWYLKTKLGKIYYNQLKILIQNILNIVIHRLFKVVVIMI